MIAPLANAAWWLGNLPAYAAFRAALAEPALVQRRLLRGYVERNADTAFGRRHGFDRIGSPDEFRRRVPVADYDALAGDIDRVAAGEPGVLTAEPVVRLATSSGSTRARKLIPYTRGLQREFNRAIGPWIVDLYARDPSLAGGCAYWSISPAVDLGEARERPKGPPIGLEEDSAYLGGAARRLVDAAMAVPAGVRHLRDISTHRYVTARLLLGRADLRLISVWHPSFLDLLLDAVRERWDELLDDVARGTCAALLSAPSACRLRPDVERAAVLRDAGPDDVGGIWPRLRLVSCWADAHAAGAAAALARRLGASIVVQPKGLLATEAFVTIPFAGRWPLAVRSHYVEFLDDAGRARAADELREGAEYEPIVTTAGGLWRYRLGDRVRVDGRVGRTPSLRLVGRADHVVDRRGEKLSEGFVGGALRATLAAFGIDASSFSLLAPEAHDGLDRYVLFLAAKGAPPAALAEALDRRLCENPHYAYCRALGQLAPAAVVPVGADAASRWLHAEAAAGRRLGDVKATALTHRDDVRRILTLPHRRRFAVESSSEISIETRLTVKIVDRELGGTVSLLAKSTHLTLAQHTRDVMTAFGALFGDGVVPTSLGAAWLGFFGVDDAATFLRHGRAAAFCHDWGKANEGFQRMVVGRGEQLLRHEFVSAILMCWPSVDRWLAAGGYDVPLLVSAVVGHHLKAEEPRPMQGDKMLVGDPSTPLRLRWDDAAFHADLASLAPTLGLTAAVPDDVLAVCAYDGDNGLADLSEMSDRVLDRLDEFDRAVRKDERRQRLLWAVRAALVAADAAGSALPRTGHGIADWIAGCVRFEHPTASADGLMTGDTIRDLVIDERMRRAAIPAFNPFQLACGDGRVPARALLLAPCGSGKTLAAWRWIAARLDERPRGRAIFLYPTRGTATEGFKDYAGLAGDEVAALMHGTADLDLDGLAENGEASRERTDERIAEAKLFALREWPKRVFSATVDQFLAFLQHGHGATCQLPLLADAVLVIDEVHSYDRGMWSALLEFLRTFPDVPVLCMTATLLSRRVDELRACGLAIVNGLDLDGGDGSALALAANHPRYRVRRVADRSTADEIVAEALRAGRRVLWVVNTVDRCQAIARAFAADVDADELATADGVRVFCYHGRFKLDDRKTWHERVVAAFKPAGNADGGVLAVTTQVCEMSLDLDADLLVTELCPATALVQRMGRCCRDPRAHESGRVGDAVIYSPERALPYAKPDLDAADAIVDRMADRVVSQQALADLLDTVAGKVELNKACRFTKSGAWAAAGEEQFRDSDDLSRQALMPDDLDEYGRLRDPCRRGDDPPWLADALVMSLPKANVQAHGKPDLPPWLNIARNGTYRSALGFCAGELPLFSTL